MTVEHFSADHDRDERRMASAQDGSGMSVHMTDVLYGDDEPFFSSPHFAPSVRNARGKRKKRYSSVVDPENDGDHWEEMAAIPPDLQAEIDKEKQLRDADPQLIINFGKIAARNAAFDARTRHIIATTPDPAQLAIRLKTHEAQRTRGA